MDLRLSPKVLASFVDADSKRPDVRKLYQQHEYLDAYAKHTDLRVARDPLIAVGREDWETHGTAQLEFLKSEGLLPEHALLDVGCGVGRGARKFVEYLDPLRYVGTDISQAALDYAMQLAKREGWSERCPMFYRDADLAVVGTFDVIWAYSVFTHTPPQQCLTMIANAAVCLKPGGQFLFTYARREKMLRFGLKQFGYPFEFFADLAARCGLVAEDHPRVWGEKQQTLRLRHAV